MTHRARIRADRLLAVPAALVFNAFARLLGAVMNRPHSSAPASVNRIIVAKLVGMGSILQAIPLLRSLKHSYPNCKLTFLTLRSNHELVRRIAEIDEVILLDDRGVIAMLVTTFKAVVAMIRQHADIYFDLEIYSAFASLLALWAVSRNRVGFYRGIARYKNGIYTHLIYFNTHMAVRELYLQLGRVVGATGGEVRSASQKWVTEDERAQARALIYRDNRLGPDEPYIVVNPNASDLVLERRWPAKHMVQAMDALCRDGRKIVLIGSKSETPYVQSILEMMSEQSRQNIISTAGELDIGGLLAVLEGAACVLTNDTGPMHMAIELGRPTVCLFGPVSPEHYGHEEIGNVEIIYAPVLCSPCVHVVDPPPCNGDNVCMQRIEPDVVVAAVKRLLAGACEGAARVTRLPLITISARGMPLGVVVRASLDEGADLTARQSD